MRTCGPQRTSALLKIGVLLAALLAAGSASSQIMELSQPGLSRNVGLRDGGAGGYWLNRDDCLADDVLHFPLRLANNAGFALTVWATESVALDCRETTLRSSAGRECWPLFFGKFPEGQAQIDLPVRDLLARGRGAGTLQTCLGKEQLNPSHQPIVIWFMHVVTDERSESSGVSMFFTTQYDLLPPAGPVVSLASQEPTLSLHWSQVLDPDVAGYRVYCDSAPAPTSSGTGLAEPPCVSSVLSASLPPSADATLCGDVESPSTIEAEVSGLTSGQRYAVAVAAYDLAGNVGPLSNVVCGAPRDPEGRVDINGRGGCGCVIAPARVESRPFASLWLWLLIGGVLRTALRRRRRARCPSRPGRLRPPGG